MEVVPLFSKIYGEGRPLIILHGLFGMGDNWTTLAKIIASNGWQVHAVDQRNHGRSPHHEQHNYDALAADLEQYIEDRKLENAVLLGHSNNGSCSSAIAAHTPRYENDESPRPPSTRTWPTVPAHCETWYNDHTATTARTAHIHRWEGISLQPCSTETGGQTDLACVRLDPLCVVSTISDNPN